MSLNKIFITFSIGFLFSIFTSNILFHINKILIFLIGTMILFLIILIFMKKYHFFVIYLALGVFLGSFYSGINNLFLDNKIEKIHNYLNKEVEINGKVEYLYKKTDNYNSYIVSVKSINDEHIKSKFLLYVTPNLKLQENDLIFIKSKLDKLDNSSSNFDYVKFMYSKGILFKVSYSNIKITGKEKVNIIDKSATFVRQKFLENINSLYPKNEASLLSGILIGARENISKDMENDFNNSGLTHLMAVSGFNITIIIIFLGFLCNYLPLFLRFAVISFGIIFFTLLVGDNIAVFRASIMGIVGYYLLISGRKGDNLSVVLFTCVLLTFYSPLSLNYDVSLHLSFLAVLGLLYTSDFWSKIFFFLPKFFAIRESFVLTVSAMTTTLPIMLFNFGQFSFFSPISNMLVGGIMPFAMFFGFLSIILNILNENLGFYIGYLEYFLLKFVNLVANFFGNLEFSIIKFEISEFSFFYEILYFMILIFIIIYFKDSKKEKTPE